MKIMKNLDVKELGTLLISLSSCKAAIGWVKGKSLAEAWATCHRGDWMLWLAARYGDVPQKTIVAIACDCAEPALAFTSDPRPAECISVVRRWLKDEATISDVRAAGAAAVDAYAYAAAYAAAAAYAVFAAYAAADAAYAAADAPHAAFDAAADAAGAAADAADADAAADAACRRRRNRHRAESLQFSADICRKHISVEDNHDQNCH
jgi:type IV secretory pathway VirB6-like protein